MLKSTIKLSPFSTKQKLYLYFGFKSRFCVAEGSVRSGKSIMDCLIAADYLDKCEDAIHLASGSTVGAAETIIGDCNGFGLAHLFKGRCEWGKFRQNEALYIRTTSGGNKAMISKEKQGSGNYNKVVIFVGGGKANSFTHIRGYSIGLWIATEIDLHYDSDDSRTSFVKNALDRQIAAIDPKTIWDFNPCDPHNPIYADYVDKYKQDYIGGYAYIHTVLTDNLSLSPERIEQIKSTHDKNSVWYKRDILGQRCVAEGLIYNYFNNHTEAMELPNDYEINADTLYLGVDFGGNKSATTFVASYVPDTMEEVITVLDERIKESLNPTSLYERFKSFIHRLTVLYPRVKIYKVRCDSAESNLIQGMKMLAMTMGVYIDILYSWKIAINDRIRFYDGIQSNGHYHYLERCTETRDAFAGASWDPKKTDTRLDITSYDNPVDILDAAEYSVEPLMKQITEAQLYVQQ